MSPLLLQESARTFELENEFWMESSESDWRMVNDLLLFLSHCLTGRNMILLSSMQLSVYSGSSNTALQALLVSRSTCTEYPKCKLSHYQRSLLSSISLMTKTWKNVSHGLCLRNSVRIITRSLGILGPSSEHPGGGVCSALSCFWWNSYCWSAKLLTGCQAVTFIYSTTTVPCTS